MIIVLEIGSHGNRNIQGKCMTVLNEAPGPVLSPSVPELTPL